MAPLITLVVASIMDEVTSFLQKLAFLSSFSLHSSNKTSIYLVSTSSYKLSVKSILFLTCI